MVRAAGGRVMSGRWWHQGPVGRPLVFCPGTSRGPGRYHRGGGSGAWYASTSMRASWCELFRHFPDAGVDPFEVRRRAGQVEVADLAVLDLTDPAVRLAVGVDEAALVGDDYTWCQQLADAARAAGLDGVLAPSAALPGQATLAVFFDAVDAGKITEVSSRVQVAPLNLVNHLHQVQPVPAARAAFTVFIERVQRVPYPQLRRRYRRR